MSEPTCIDPERQWGCMSEACRWYPRCRLRAMDAAEPSPVVVDEDEPDEQRLGWRQW